MPQVIINNLINMTLKKEFERLLIVLHQDGDLSDLGLRILEGFSLNLENSCALNETQAVRQNEDAEDVCDYCNGSGLDPKNKTLWYKPCPRC